MAPCVLRRDSNRRACEQSERQSYDCQNDSRSQADNRKAPDYGLQGGPMKHGGLLSHVEKKPRLLSYRFYFTSHLACRSRPSTRRRLWLHAVGQIARETTPFTRELNSFASTPTPRSLLCRYDILFSIYANVQIVFTSKATLKPARQRINCSMNVSSPA